MSTSELTIYNAHDKSELFKIPREDLSSMDIKSFKAMIVEKFSDFDESKFCIWTQETGGGNSILVETLDDEDLHSSERLVPCFVCTRDDTFLVVRTLVGNNIGFPCDVETIYDIKEAIQDKEGIPPDQQRLIYSGKQTDDEQTLKELGIKGGSFLYLVLRLAGGR